MRRRDGEESGLSLRMHELVNLCASQINGGSAAVDLSSRELKSRRDGRTHFAVGAWRDNPCFSDDERAAPALTEAVTRLADRPDPVPDAVFEDAARHFNERTLAALIVAIANINVWNRLNVTVRQVVGEWQG